MKIKKSKIILLAIIILIVIFLVLFAIFSKDIAEPSMFLSDNFPDSYKPYINELKNKHPNWSFKALYTSLDWQYVISQENIYGKNLVPKSYSDNWKNTKPGEYNVEIDAGWVDSSKKAVEYAMDPRNFLNSVRIFQFEELSYEASSNTVSNIEKILYGTEFYNKIVEYKTASGSNIVMKEKYSDLILKAARTSDVSGFHLASRIKQEVGPFLSHSSISGTVPGYEGYYNFYNIGATSSSEPMGAIKNGLQYAKDGKGASQTTKNKYLIPWNTKERAITGGGNFIGSSYINLGQNTIYLQKFHVSDNENGELFWHQYMTNVLAPYSEGKLIYQGYEKSNMLDSEMSFIIPIYENMPELPCETPNISSTDFKIDNTRVYADVTTTLNVRTGPGTSYETLTSVTKDQIMTRIAKGKQAGEVWDRVKLENGLVGYVFSSYLAITPDIEVERITLSLENTILQKQERKSLKIGILPENVQDKTLTFSSSNPQVVSVDSRGNLVAISRGTATITAEARNGVTGSIKVSVYSKVTGLTTKEDSLILQIGENYQISPIVSPEDANNPKVNFTSQNTNIAIVDEQGNVKGLQEGNTKISLTTQEGAYKKEIQVTVIKKLPEGSIEISKELTINGNQITGWQENKTTVRDIIQKITTTYDIQVEDSNGKILTGNKLAGTGSKIKILDGQNVVIEYVIILYGDVNGDGKINSVDLLVLQRHILELKPLTGVFLKAGNIDKTGNRPTSVDLLKIQRHILGLKIIEQ